MVDAQSNDDNLMVPKRLRITDIASASDAKQTTTESSSIRAINLQYPGLEEGKILMPGRRTLCNQSLGHLSFTIKRPTEDK